KNHPVIKYAAMFLSIDAGNSNIVFGFFDPSLCQWNLQLRIETQKAVSYFELDQKLNLFFLEHNLQPDQIRQIGFSSVVREVNNAIEEFCANFFGIRPYLINGSSYAKLKVSTSRPNEIGTDLMANVTAAYAHFNDGCIIVDFGTALTFSVVDNDGTV